MTLPLTQSRPRSLKIRVNAFADRSAALPASLASRAAHASSAMPPSRALHALVLGTAVAVAILAAR